MVVADAEARRRSRAWAGGAISAASTGAACEVDDDRARCAARASRASPRGRAPPTAGAGSAAVPARSAISAMPVAGHQNVEWRHASPPWPRSGGTMRQSGPRRKPRRPFRSRRADVAHRRRCQARSQRRARAPPPAGAAADPRRFPLLRRARSRDRTGALVVLGGENGAGKTNLLEALSLFAPGRGLRRAELPTARGSAAPAASRFRSRSRRRARSRQLGVGLEPRPTASGRPRGRTASTARRVASARAFADHLRIVWLTPAMDGLFIGPASERRRFLDRLVLAIDPAARRARQPASSARCAGATACSRRATRNAAWLDALEREAAELGVAVAAARRECVDRLKATIARERDDDPRPFPGPTLALEGEVEALVAEQPALDAEERYRALLRDNRGARRRRRPHADRPPCRRSHGLARPQGRAGRRSPRPANRRRCWSASCSPTRGWSPTCRASRRWRCSTRSRRISIRAAAPPCSRRWSGSAAQVFVTGADPAAFAELGSRAQVSK